MISASASGGSADVGSSSTMSLGSVAIARAIEQRCSAPGESIAESRRPTLGGRPTMRSSSSARVAPLAPSELRVDAQRLGDLATDGHLRVERVERLLEDDLHVGAHAPELALVECS